MLRLRGILRILSRDRRCGYCLAFALGFVTAVIILVSKYQLGDCVKLLVQNSQKKFGTSTGETAALGDDFNHVTSLLLFVGYPRSGHTLVSSLLDAHPHVAVANEYKLLGHWLTFDAKQRTRKYIFEELYRDSLMQSKEGYRSSKVKHTFNYSVPNQWNGHYDRFLKVVGDKHGPQTTYFLKEKEHESVVDEISQHLKTNVRFLHVVRNPHDNIATMAVRQVEGRLFIQQGNVLNKSDVVDFQIRSYLRLVSINSLLLEKYKVHTIYAEDLVASPKKVLSSVCEFLDLKCGTKYLSDCASLVFGNPSTTRNNVVWTPEQRKLVDVAIMKYSFLNRYAVNSTLVGKS